MAGTSAGARKGWETRRRARAAFRVEYGGSIRHTRTPAEVRVFEQQRLEREYRQSRRAAPPPPAKPKPKPAKQPKQQKKAGARKVKPKSDELTRLRERERAAQATVDDLHAQAAKLGAAMRVYHQSRPGSPGRPTPAQYEQMQVKTHGLIIPTLNAEARLKAIRTRIRNLGG